MGGKLKLNLKNLAMFEKIINLLEKITIENIYFDNSDCIKHEQKIGAYTFEIYINFNTKHLNYIGSSYLNPEEADAEYTIKSIGEVYVYDMNNNLIKLSDKEIEAIVSVLDFNLVGETKINN